MKSRRFEDRTPEQRRGFEGRLRGPRSWAGGLLGGGHARPRHYPEEAIQPPSARHLPPSEQQAVSRNIKSQKGLDRCIHFGEEPEKRGRPMA
jgi:hypothetical protein